MKGVIPHTPSTKDQLKARILEVLEPQQPPSSITYNEPQDSTSAASVTPCGDHETTPRITAEPSHSEAQHQTIQVPPTIISGTPSSDASPHQAQAASNRHITEVERAPEQGSEAQAASQSAIQTDPPRQAMGDPTKSTPQQDWKRMQRQRERQQHEERERIKAQIRYDHAERRQLDELRRQPVSDLTSSNQSYSAKPPSKHLGSAEVRIQVRTLDGSILRSTFVKDATISSQVRPWLDSAAQQTKPYNLKIILTPQPNHLIEPAEEKQSLEDLDIIDSCTLVMVPVKGFVDSYARPESGLIGSAVSSGYSLLSGSIGAVLNGVRSVLGFGQVRFEPQPPPAEEGASPNPSTRQTRFRTLADQRAEARKKDHQLYNGNQLNFEPRKDDGDAETDGASSPNK